jgi:hypothetical protein
MGSPQARHLNSSGLIIPLRLCRIAYGRNFMNFSAGIVLQKAWPFQKNYLPVMHFFWPISKA